MKNPIYQKLNKISFPLFALLSLSFSQVSYSEDYQNYDFKNKNKEKALSVEKRLLPLPSIDIQLITGKVNTQRNPFQKPLESEISNTEDLYSTLLFKGLASSNDFLYAIIETGNIQKFYKVGDTLENGFFIKSISLEDISVDISNGSSEYRLSLTNFKNAL